MYAVTHITFFLKQKIRKKDKKKRSLRNFRAAFKFSILKTTAELSQSACVTQTLRRKHCSYTFPKILTKSQIKKIYNLFLKMFSVSIINGRKTIKVVLAAGTFLFFSDVLYSLYLSWYRARNKLKKYPSLESITKRKKKLKNVSNKKDENMNKKKETGKITLTPPNRDSTPYRNPWFRYLPRTDFRTQPQELLWNTALFFPEILPDQEFSQSKLSIFHLKSRSN
jgi:hypothetical protein